MPLKPVIGDFVNVPSSGGSGAPQLPAWTFVAGGSTTPASGTFTADGANLAAANAIFLSLTAKGGSVDFSGLFGALSASTTALVITSPTGLASVCTLTGITVGASAINLSISGSVREAAALVSGDYIFSIWPYSVFIPVLANVLSVSSITPCADGTVTPVTSITTQSGIITAIS